MARPSVLAALLSAALALPTAAAAAPRRISIGPVTGDRSAALSTQLAETLCGTFECVLWPRIATAGRPDAAKLRRARVDGVLTGAVRGSRVSVVLSGPAGALDRWAFDLGPGRRLRGEALDRIAADVGRRLAPPRAAPPPPAAAQAPAPDAAPSPPQPPAKVMRPPEPPPQAVPPRTPAPGAAGPRLDPPAPPPRRPPPAAPRPSQPRIALELGGFWSSRSLTFGGAAPGAGTLFEFDASAILGPRGRLELYPAAGLTTGPAAGLGVFAEAARSIGLTTEPPGGGDDRDSVYSRVSAGVLWRVPLGGRVWLVPSLAYDSLKLRVDPEIPGLPEADLSGFAAKVGGELRALARVKVLLAVGYVRWVTARDLVEGDVAYFPGGSASALETEAGADVALSGPFSIRVLAQLSNTSYDLDADPTGTYVASDATDRFVSAHASLRAEF
jgi:hypothetical protein